MSDTQVRVHLEALAAIMKSYRGRLTFDSTFGVTLSNSAYMSQGLDEITDEINKHLAEPPSTDKLTTKPFFGDMK